MNSLFMQVLLTILMAANVFLFCVLICFSKNKKDTASRVGFGFMELVTLANIAVVVWRIFG